MKLSIDCHLIRRCTAAACLLTVVLALPLLADEQRVGRYQSVSDAATAAQRDPLQQIVERNFGPGTVTVGEAIQALLEGSGYRLLSSKFAEPYRVMLFGMPLPEAQRQLGPISLREALEVLSGEGFAVVIDPVYRLVDFRLAATAGTDEQIRAD